jgi:hypothetical protein
MFFESPLESGFGTVADALGYGAKADAAFDQSGRNLHSPAPEISDDSGDVLCGRRQRG